MSSSEDWTCHICTYKSNPNTLLNCDLCEAPRAPEIAQRTPAYSQSSILSRPSPPPTSGTPIVIDIRDDDDDLTPTVHAEQHRAKRRRVPKDDDVILLLDSDDDENDPRTTTTATVSFSKQLAEARLAAAARASSSKTLTAPPQLYHYLHCEQHPAHLNASSLSLADIFSGSFTSALLSNFLIDLSHLVSEAPNLRSVPSLVLHGRGLVRGFTQPPEMKLHEVPLPSKWGSHHSKFALVFFPTGIRVAVMTCNWINEPHLTNAVYVQDFPLKGSSSAPPFSSSSSPFEDTLIAYLSKVGGPVTEGGWLEKVRAHDFSRSNAILVASVPGYYQTTPPNRAWGIDFLRRQLGDVPRLGPASNVLCQFSSLGGTSEAHVNSLLSVFSTTNDPTSTWDASSKVPPPDSLKKKVQIVWPSVQNLIDSYAGTRSGGAIPAPLASVFDSTPSGLQVKKSLAQYLHLWRRRSDGPRTRAAPHIKTFLRYRDGGEELSWLLLTSHNFSKSAWGQMQKKGTQIHMASYELGVLFKPSLFVGAPGEGGRPFSCTPEHKKMGLMGLLNTQALRFPEPPTITASGEPGGARRLYCPVPYALPPAPYGPGGESWRGMPWCSDWSGAERMKPRACHFPVK